MLMPSKVEIAPFPWEGTPHARKILGALWALLFCEITLLGPPPRLSSQSTIPVAAGSWVENKAEDQPPSYPWSHPHLDLLGLKRSGFSEGRRSLPPLQPIFSLVLCCFFLQWFLSGLQGSVTSEPWLLTEFRFLLFWTYLKLARSGVEERGSLMDIVILFVCSVFEPSSSF